MSENSEKGFTLIEVMIALAILSGVVVTVLSSLNYHLRVAARGREDVAAALIGKNRLEELMLGSELGGSSGSFEAPFDAYSWSFTAENTELEKLKKFTLTVKWDENRELRLVSYAITG